MAQARRKSSKARDNPRSWSGLGMLLAGVVIGALAMQLWHSGGAQRLLGDLALFGGRAPAVESTAPAESESAPDEAAKPVTDFTFFTLLPDIEIIAPSPPDAESESKPTPDESTVAKTKTDDAAAPPGPAVRDATTPAAPASQFMLQAGSYRTAADADRLKATLALNGLASEIQKVTIQGRGDFYRVRLGPFATYRAMVEVDRQLGRAGIKALRLKMKAG